MDPSQERLTYLFNCYYAKTISPQEKDELFHLLNISTDDDLIASLLKEAWDRLPDQEVVFENSKSDQILGNILHAKKEEHIIELPRRDNKPIWRPLSVAAAVLLLVSVGVLFFRHHSGKISSNHTIAQKKLLRDAMPGGNKAVLKLANGKTIVLDNAQNGVLAQQGNVEVKKAENGLVVYNAIDKSVLESNALNTITTPRGGQYQVVLPDGSKVWLNAASSIEFPTSFSGNTRNVSITGEAYFEVAKNAAKPFLVKTNKAVIEVLGTHFNIMAYDDEADMKTTLLEGAVKVKSANTTSYLKPGQQAVLNSEGRSKVLNDVDVDDATAWKNGIFQFSDAGIEVIMRQAARWYDVNVSYEGQIPVKQFTGRISRNVKASELLNMLAYTGVKFRIEGKNIIVTK